MNKADYDARRVAVLQELGDAMKAHQRLVDEMPNAVSDDDANPIKRSTDKAIDRIQTAKRRLEVLRMMIITS